jgi:hypothetical protein
MALIEMGQPVAYDLPLPLVLKNAGWKVKIFDREIREPPHLTIIRRTQRWRINLRTRTFMDARRFCRKFSSEVICGMLSLYDQR